MRPGYLRLSALVVSSAVSAVLLLRISSLHARIAPNDAPWTYLSSGALGAVPLIFAIVSLRRVFLTPLPVPRGAGRFLLASLLGPLGFWLALRAGPHAGADILLFYVTVFVQGVLFASSLNAGKGN